MTSVAPGAEKRSVICDVIAAPCSVASRSSARPGAHPAGWDHEHREQSKASSVICHDSRNITASVSTRAMTLVTTPASADVNASLGADHVVVEPADQRARVGAGEEGDRHPLHVGSNTCRRRSRISSSPRRDDVQRPQADAGLDDGMTMGESDGDADDRAGRASFDDGVDGLPGQQRGDHAEHGRGCGQYQERDDRARCGRANAAHSPKGGPADGPAGRPSCMALRSAIHMLKSDMGLTVGPQVPLRSTSPP